MQSLSRLPLNRRNLLIDPRTRKIIVIENPLLSTRIKEMIARILFDNLQVSWWVCDRPIRYTGNDGAADPD